MLRFIQCLQKTALVLNKYSNRRIVRAAPAFCSSYKRPSGLQGAYEAAFPKNNQFDENKLDDETKRKLLEIKVEVCSHDNRSYGHVV